MRTYRIRVDGKEYEMDISLIGEEVISESESGILVGEKLAYSLKAEEEPGAKKTNETR